MAAADNIPPFSPFSVAIKAGPRSTLFNDHDDAKGRQIIGVDSINIWVDKVVTGMQVTYNLASGKRYRAPLRGSQLGKKTRVRLKADEEVIQLSGRGNSGSITSLSLLSTKPDGSVRLHGPFGEGEILTKESGKKVPYRRVEMILGGSDDRGFSWYGSKLMAFTGATRNGRLNGLGVLSAPLVEVADGLTSTSVITEEYRERASGSKGQKKLRPYPAYRSTLSVPQTTKEITLWAEEQLKVEIDGRTYTLDPIKPTVVKPNALGKISVTVDATDIFVPAIKVRTDNLGDPWQWTTLHPDVAVHQKIANWDTDTLYNSRRKLGIPNKFTREDCAAIQIAVTNVAKLGLPAEGQATHERQIDTGNMDDANWVLDLGGEALSYSAASKSDVKAATAGATIITTGASSGIKKKLKKVKKKAKKKAKKAAGGVSKVVVQTAKTKPVKAVAKTAKKAGASKVVKDAGKLGKDVAQSGKQLAKDVAKGDIEGFGKHLGQGGLQLGKNVTKLGKHAVITVINVAGEALEYVLDRTLALGKLMWDLLKSIGAKIAKIIKFLIDLIPWKAIARTQGQLMDVMEAALGSLVHADTKPILATIDGFFDDLREGGDKALDKATRALGGKVEPGGGLKKAGQKAGQKAKKLDSSAGVAMKKTMKLLSAPLELVNWLINKLLQAIPGLKALSQMLAAMGKKLRTLMTDITKALGRAMKVLPPALGSSVTNLMAILKDPAGAPTYIASAVLQLVKGLMGVSLEIVSELLGVVFRGLKTLATLLLDIGKLDLFPGGKKHGGVPFITDFYNLMVGGKLSIFKMLTWLLAVPITLVHLVSFGASPNLKLPAKRGMTKAMKTRQTSYMITEVICGAAELAMHSYLDGIDLLQGTGYSDIESGEDQSFSDANPKITLALEIAALGCAVLGNYCSNPYEFDPAPKKGKDIADHVFYWIGIGQLSFDIVSLIADQKRMVRADLDESVEGREGAWGTLALESVLLTAKVVVAITYKRSGKGLAGDILGGVGAVVEAGILSAFPASNPQAATACVLSDLAFGIAGTALHPVWEKI